MLQSGTKLSKYPVLQGQVFELIVLLLVEEQLVHDVAEMLHVAQV
jgi:hypothetical protein